MRTAGAAVLVVSLLGVSCASRTARSRPWPGEATTAVAAAMQRQVINAVDAGDGDLLVRSLRQRMAAEPENLAIRLELARHYETAGYPELAVEHYRLASAKFPNASEPHVRLAKSLRMSAAPAEAVAVLDEYLARHPEGPADLYSWLGILHDELGQWREAEQAHRAAQVLEPASSPLHNNLGNSYLMQDRHTEAAAQFRRALELEPRSEIARNNLGVALAANPREAVLHWQSVSGPAAAHSNMAAVLIEQGRYEEARQELTLALGYRRDHPAALENFRLLAELDGGPVTVPPDATPSFWARLWAVLRSIVVSSDEKSPKGAVETATR